MEWSWTVFLITWPIMYVISAFSRGASNRENVARYGLEADYRNNLGMAHVGSIFAGAVWAAIITAIIGLF